MSENDEKIINFAMEILGVKAKNELAILIGLAKTAPQDWSNYGLKDAVKYKIENKIKKKLFGGKNKLPSNDSRLLRYHELFVELDIEEDEDYEYKKVFNNNIHNMSGVLINDNNGTIHIDLNKKDFCSDEQDIKKLIELLKFAHSDFIHNMIEKLERIKKDSIIE
jgi:hypothetical protein